MTVKQPSQSWIAKFQNKYDSLINSEPTAFKTLVKSQIPMSAGVYLITAAKDEQEESYYVGRTTNLQTRIYDRHLHGNKDNSNFQKKLIEDGVCSNSLDARQFIKSYCSVRWIVEDDYRIRGAIEGYTIGVLFPKHGISPEGGKK
jgi:hypothetical protein